MHILEQNGPNNGQQAYEKLLKVTGLKTAEQIIQAYETLKSFDQAMTVRTRELQDVLETHEMEREQLLKELTAVKPARCMPTVCTAWIGSRRR